MRVFGASVHPNAELIQRLYASLGNHDAQTMVTCYHETARYRDIAFDLRGRAEIGSMWRMITSGDIRTIIEHVDANDQEGSAKLIDEYTFRKTGRRVRNRIVSRFLFRNGRIIDHVEESDPRAWAAMALGGVTGFLAGRFRFLRSFKARALLREFRREHPMS